MTAEDSELEAMKAEIAESVTEEKQDNQPVAIRRACGPLACFGVLTVLNALFWFTVNFGSFTPPSPGIFAERLHFFGIETPK